MSYSYVPGAGDDEESWAKGLTPALFWQHQQVSAKHELLGFTRLCRRWIIVE